MSLYRPKQHQKPLVVCIGFLGSQPRHIDKYAQAMSSITVNLEPLELIDDSKQNTTQQESYNNNSNNIHENIAHLAITTPDIIQYIPPLTSVLSLQSVKESSRNLAQKVTTAMNTVSPVSPIKQRTVSRTLPQPMTITPEHIFKDTDHYFPRKIMFFCLSNNGAFGYANMLYTMKNEMPDTFLQLSSQTSGIIWDSSPSYPSTQLFQRGFTSAFGTLLGLPPNPTYPIISPIIAYIRDYLFQQPDYITAQDQLVNTLDYLIPYHAPQLYLITSQDDMVLPHETRSFIEKRSQRVEHFFHSTLNNDFAKLHEYVHPFTSKLMSIPFTVTDTKSANALSNEQNNAAVNALHTASNFASNQQDHEDVEWNTNVVTQHQCRMIYQHIMNDYIAPYWQNKKHLEAFFPIAKQQQHREQDGKEVLRQPSTPIDRKSVV